MDTDDKLARLVADLRRAVIGFELDRNRGDRPRSRQRQAAARPRCA